MDQPELVCAHCTQTQDEAARLRTAVQTVQQQNNDLSEELAGARATQRTLEAQLRAARAENTRLRETSPTSELVKTVLTTWQTTCSKRANISSTSDRWTLAARMIKHRSAGATTDEEQALMLCRAIHGVGLKPWSLFGERHTTRPADPRAKRLVRLEHCIGTDDRVEENVLVYRRACRAAAERRQGVFTLWQQAAALESELARLVTVPVSLYEAGRDVDDIERFLWERVTEHDAFWDELLAEAERPSNVVPIRSEAA